MQRLDPRVSALYAIVAQPSAMRGYEDLAKAYSSINMVDEAEAVRFLISEKFCDNSSDTNEKQL